MSYIGKHLPDELKKIGFVEREIPPNVFPPLTELINFLLKRFGTEGNFTLTRFGDFWYCYLTKDIQGKGSTPEYAVSELILLLNYRRAQPA